MTEYDVIVCGGGPAGSTTAFYAAKTGMKVMIVVITAVKIAGPISLAESAISFRRS